MRFYLMIMTLICCSVFAMEDELPEDADYLSSIQYNHRRTQRTPLNILRNLKKGYKQWVKLTVKATNTHNWITNRLTQLFCAYVRPRLGYKPMQPAVHSIAEPLENGWQFMHNDTE